MSVLLPVLAQHHTGLCHLDLGVSDYHSQARLGSPFWGLSDLTQLTFPCLPSFKPSGEQQSIVEELGRALPHLVKLQHLDRSYYSWCASMPVVKSMTCLTYLTNIDLQDSSMNSCTTCELASSLRSLTLLQETNISENSISDDCCVQWSCTLRALTCLQNVRASTVGVGYCGALALLNVEKLPSITLLPSREQGRFTLILGGQHHSDDFSKSRVRDVYGTYDEYC